MTPDAWLLDWGHSSLRVAAWTFQQGVVEEREWPVGVTDVRATRPESVPLSTWFERQLIELARDVGSAPILACGAVGQPENWHFVPQIPCPASLADLAGATVTIPLPAASTLSQHGLSVVPGIKIDHESDGHSDVARSEEVKAFAAEPGLVCVPGTHCKWLRRSGDTIVDFRTFLTGQLYADFSRSGAISVVLDDDYREDDFDRGLRAAASGIPLLHLLFTVRADSLLRNLESPRSYLEGLLIGSEIDGVKQLFAFDLPITLIADGPKVDRYTRAIEHAGGHLVKIVSGTAATWSGLGVIFRAINPHS